MTQSEKIAYAKTILKRILAGNNPVTGERIPEGDLLKDAAVLRCMFYLYELINRESLRMEGFIPQTSDIKTEEPPAVEGKAYTDEEKLSVFGGNNDGATVSQTVRQLNELADFGGGKKLTAKAVFEWLETRGMVSAAVDKDSGKTYRCVTEKGREFGFYGEQRIDKNGHTYHAFLCDEGAQRFIAENVDAVAANAVSAVREDDERPWREKQDRKLIDMFVEGSTVDKMSRELNRTGESVRERLQTLGLISRRGDIG